MKPSLYEDYLTAPQCLSFEEMTRLHADIIKEITGDADAEDLYRMLVQTATRYASFRAGWCLWDNQKKLDSDSSRSSSHDSLIIKFNQLARYLRMQGRDAAWRDVLGFEENDPFLRKRIGDFACYIVFIDSLCAR